MALKFTDDALIDAWKKSNENMSATARMLNASRSYVNERLLKLGLGHNLYTNGLPPAVLKRNKQPLVDADAFAEHMESWANRKRIPIVPAKLGRSNGDGHLLELALYDLHFGKLCWGQETGTDYDSEIASRVFANAVHDLLHRVQGYRVDRIIMPIGQDFFHVNSWANKTAAGTDMDADTRFQKVFDTGCQAMVLALEHCAKIAPVEALWVPGNHDRETSWYMCRFLYAWFHKERRITIDNSKKRRKYVLWGKTMLGFAHTNTRTIGGLPLTMAAEEPEMWAKANTRIVHTGHEHKKGEIKYSAGDSYGGVTVVKIPSLTGTDAWHYDEGFVKSNRAAEAHLFSKTEGQVGYFSANVRE